VTVVHEAVSAAWKSVTDEWTDRARHDALFALVVQHQCFAWAAAQYNEEHKRRGDDPIAKEQLARLRRGATATMLAAAAARPEKTKQPYRNTMIVMMVMLAALVLGILVTKSIYDNTPPRPTKPARG
jgi:hypothetical protein